MEVQKVEATGDGARQTTENEKEVPKVEKPVVENGEVCSKTKIASAEDEKEMSEMFTDDIVNDMKQDLGDNTTENIAVKENEFTDQSDQQDIEALEIKMKNSERNEALQLFQQGKRNLFVKDFEAAVETLASACEKYSSIYGELSIECGEVFMAYGHALVELWRNEELNKREDEELNSTNQTHNNVTVEETNGKENEAEVKVNGKENEEETKVEKSVETGVEPAANGEAEKIEEPGDEDVEKPNEEDAQPNGDGIAEENVEENDDESSEENNDEDECGDDEEVDNLQLAWEIFETAKNIYTKHNDDANLAKVFTKLGEISIASDNYELAIEDLKKSLDILSKFDSAKPRQVADTHFLLYTAYAANYNFDLAEMQLRKAKNIIEEQMETLNEKSADLPSESSEANQINTEMKELEELTKDMQEKLTELSASKRQVVSAISKTIINKMEDHKPTPSVGEAAGSSSSIMADVSKTSSNVPVNNISHLIRKKPKTNASEEKPEKQNNVTNGEAVVKSNGSEQTEAVESAVPIKDSQTCKRKAEDELENTESMKKQCVS